MSQDELVAALERERLQGMPRWNVGPRGTMNGTKEKGPGGNRGRTAKTVEES